MQESKSYAFVPTFYLDWWKGDDGRLCATRNIFGTLAQFRNAPAEVAFEYYLYADHEDLDADEHAAIASGLFEPLARHGERIVARLIAGTPLAAADALLWARFLASMRPRPTMVGGRPRTADPDDETSTAAPIDPLAGDVAAPGGPAPADDGTGLLRWQPVPRATAAEIATAAADAAPLPDFAFDTAAADRTLGFDWLVVDLKRSRHRLLTSDWLCVYTRPLDDPECTVSLPLSPAHAFFAVPSHSMAKRDLLALRSPRRLATALNLSVLGQAHRFAYSRAADDAPARFLRRHVPFDPTE